MASDFGPSSSYNRGSSVDHVDDETDILFNLASAFWHHFTLSHVLSICMYKLNGATATAV